MGGGHSVANEEHFAAELFHLAQSSLMLPDIGIDDSILKYSGLDSADVLKDYSFQMVDELVSKSPAYVADLGSVLTGFKGVPNAVGLGALMISFFLDITIGLLMPQSSQNTMDMMRRIFAEEKASGVRDTMDEYLKRFHMHMHHPSQLLEDTKYLEKQLSEKLTSLRNSMLHDDQMSTRSLKYWTNGAAFHMQMLIHVARLGMANSSRSESDLNLRVGSISRMAGLYQNYLKTLLEKYESFKRSKIRIVPTKFMCTAPGGVAACMSAACGIYDGELEKRTGQKHTYCISTDTYLNYMFQKWDQKQQLKEYFTGLQSNLRELILQNQTFNIQTLTQGIKNRRISKD